MVNIFIVHRGSDSETVKYFIQELNNEINKRLGRDKNDKRSVANPLSLEGYNNSFWSRHFWKSGVKRDLKKANMVIYTVGDDSANNKNITWEIRTAAKLNKEIVVYKLNPQYGTGNEIHKKDSFTGLEKDIGIQCNTISDIAKIIVNYTNGNYPLFNDQNVQDDSGRHELFEQYKIYLQTSETLVARRQSVNSFYITANTAIFTMAGIALSLGQDISQKLLICICLAVPGLIIDLSWSNILESYGTLNSSKMKIISIMEKELPAKLYDTEWLVMCDKLNNHKYVSFTASEKIIPKIFCVIYIIAVLICFILLIF